MRPIRERQELMITPRSGACATGRIGLPSRDMEKAIGEAHLGQGESSSAICTLTCGGHWLPDGNAGKAVGCMSVG